ncbi:MAG: DUF1232 domain-containing protein [Treponema sp.]|nr:DUF1232 domain-containing protein [Treponema sp.]
MFGFNRSNAEELSEKEARRVNEKFNSFKNKKYSEEDMHKVFDNEEKIMGKMNDKNLRDFVEDVKTFFSMLKDFFTKKYTEVPVGTIMAIAGSLLYVLLPADIIPDFIPVVGYLDDAAVLAACMGFVRGDVEKYKDWRGEE